MPNWVQTIWGRASAGIRKFWKLRARVNGYMRRRHSVNRLAVLTTAVCGALMVIALFVPNYLGVGNDSLAETKMGYYRLAYPAGDSAPGEDAANAYFTRVYGLTSLDRGAEFSLQSALVNAAKALDWFFTRDRLFDVRFLALLYALLYLPGVCLMVKAALECVGNFSEAILLAAFGALIFSDISYIAYFNSLYADALYYILLLYMAGSALLLRRERPRQNLYILLLGISSAGFCLVAKRSFPAGIIAAFFLLMHLRYILERRARVLSVVMAGVVLTAVMVSAFRVSGEFDDTGKYHAMTRGVLLQSNDPVKALEGMGIGAEYSVLTDDSLYAYYPATRLANPLISENFLKSYSTSDLALFYLRHPGALISMWDLGAKAAVNLRRDYCGNYERSTGAPPMGKSLFCSAWSIFKQQSAPKTIGYLLVLLLIVFAVSGRKLFGRRVHAQRRDLTYFLTCVCLAAIGLLDMTYVILHSGDAQLAQFNIVPGAVMDILVYFVAAELLHKLNLLEEDGDGDVQGGNQGGRIGTPAKAAGRHDPERGTGGLPAGDHRGGPHGGPGGERTQDPLSRYALCHLWGDLVGGVSVSIHRHHRRRASNAGVHRLSALRGLGRRAKHRGAGLCLAGPAHAPDRRHDPVYDQHAQGGKVDGYFGGQAPEHGGH